MKQVYARVRLYDRAWYLHDLVRLVEGVSYSTRMQRAGVPEKVRRKILRRWKPWAYAVRKEHAGLLRDLARREAA